MLNVSTAALSFSIALSTGWKIQDSKVVTTQNPQTISQNAFPTTDWTATSVPSTVMGALVNTGKYGDPFYGDNFLKLPGTGTYYHVLQNFGLEVTPTKSPFGRPWWYRNEFNLSNDIVGKHIEINFMGITEGAEIWFNGNKIATPEQTEGSYRSHRFDITKFVNPGANTVAVLVYPPKPDSLTPSWVDWNPTPQDKNMGLWREVFLSVHGDVAILHPQVITRLPLPSLASANLTVEADVHNTSDHAVSGTLVGDIEDIHFEQPVTLNANEARTLSLTSDNFPQLTVRSPRLWWPAQMGKPELYKLHLKFVADGGTSDESEINFGIRQVDSGLQEKSRLFYINGKPIQIRGGGWASDIFLRFDKARLEKEFAYIKDLGLNTIRLEGRFENDDLLDIADREGVLVMPGWVCCNSWQDNDKWQPKHFEIAKASIRDVLYQFRTHPSVFVFLYGSDEAPPEKIETIYYSAIKDYHWPNPFLNSAQERDTPLAGKSGVKMMGPYEYTPPSYWYIDRTYGGAYGFATEISPGPTVPVMETIKEFLPPNHLWPMDDVWRMHVGENDFDLKVITNAINQRYGTVKDLPDFVEKAQVIGYDNHRAMFEAYGKNKYHSATGIVQWMLNSAWPSMNWHLYDYSLRQGGAYFGTKKANEALHVQYSLDDQSVVVVNSTYSAVQNLTVSAQLLDFDLNVLNSQTVTLNVDADSSRSALTLPQPKDYSPLKHKTYFVSLKLADAAGHVVSNNFYWLSTQAETYNWDGTDFKYTPVTQEADLRDLASLPPTSIKIETRRSYRHLNEESVKVTNTGDTLAFFIHAQVFDKATGTDIRPVLWDDNDITLLPHESRTIHYRIPFNHRNRDGQEVRIDGWNLQNPGKSEGAF